MDSQTLSLICVFVWLIGWVVLEKFRVDRLRKAIRTHRDARGNDRCWLDDEKLYRELPDHEAITVLPDKETFLGNCARFHANRQHPYHLELFKGEHPGGATPPRVDLTPQTETEQVASPPDLELEFTASEAYARGHQDGWDEALEQSAEHIRRWSDMMEGSLTDRIRSMRTRKSEGT